MMSFRKLHDWPFKNWLVVIFALALLVRAWVVAAIIEEPQRVVLSSDSDQYLAAAEGLYETARFVTRYDQYHFETGGGYYFEMVRTPGYPLLIALLRVLTGQNPPLVPLILLQAI